MNDPGVIDRFFEVFSRYIDSGFGLLGGEVAFLSTTLVAIDITLAALFWAWAPGEDVLARLIKKTLYVGFFAFLIGNFHALSTIILQSFSGLGLKAAGGGLSAEDFLRPGRVAAAGIAAAMPMLEAAGELSGFPAFFENIVQVVVLLVGWLVVVIAFFIISVQLFVCLIEFKLTTLAGFVLVPFGLFGRTAFLAERVLGNVIAAGVKVMVLAVITGIGASLFSEFTAGPGQPDLKTVLAMALAALTLLGLSIFGPGIAAGLVSGAPQLGAGAAVGTGLLVGGVAMAGAGAVQLAAGGGASLAAGAAGAGGGRPGPSGGGGDLRPPPSGPQGSGPGPGPAPAGGAPGAVPSPKASGGGSEGSSGGGSDTGSDGGGPEGAPPAWARDLQHRQAMAHGAGLALHAAGSGDAHGGGANPSLSEDH